MCASDSAVAHGYAFQVILIVCYQMSEICVAFNV